MNERAWLMGVIFIAISLAIVMGASVISSAPTMKETYKEIYINGELPHHDNFTYMLHYVKIHIVPEEPNLTVVTKVEGSSYSEIWITDNNSEIVIEAISFEKYKVNVRGHSYFIYPQESEYIINTERMK